MAAKEKKKASILNCSVAVRSDCIVTVEIGSEHIKYSIHKALLTDHSEYFARALSGPWTEAEECKVTLNDVEPGIFNVFVNYIYGQNIPSTYEQWMKVIEEKAMVPDSTEQTCAVDLARIKSICLADRLVAPDLKKALHNAYVDACMFDDVDFKPNIPLYTSVIYAFHHLPPDDPLLRLLVDTQSYFWKDQDDTENNGDIQLRKELPQDFLLGVMLKMSQIMRDNFEKRIYPCDYHIHDNEEDENECKILFRSLSFKINSIFRISRDGRARTMRRERG